MIASRVRNAAACLVSATLAATAAAQSDDAATPTSVVDSEQARFEIVTLAEGLVRPWSLAFLPNGDMLVTEKPGRLRRIRDGVLLPDAIAGTPDDVYWSGDSGLLEVLPHPNFTTNGFVYLSYAAGTPEANRTTLVRGRLEGDVLVDLETLFAVGVDKEGVSHPGGRLIFLPDGTLLMSVGDGYALLHEARNLENALGAFVRLNDDGSIPEDNPAFDIENARPEIYSYGHRNPQGLARRPGTDEIWSHEHGPRGGDEINVLRPGADYGWPAITYGVDYDGTIISEDRRAEGMEQPVWYWVPSIAPSGMAFYEGEAFPEWNGDLFVGALAAQHIQRFELDGDRIIGMEPLLVDLEERIRDVRTGPDGYLYVVTDSDEARVLRLEPR